MLFLGYLKWGVVVMMGILKIQNEEAYYSLKIDAFVIFESITNYACAYFIWTWGNAILLHPNLFCQSQHITRLTQPDY